ncbi:MAG: DUF2619 domain-containing protein [bacterium]
MYISKILLSMILIRMLSSFIELSAAALMYYFKNVETAIRINAVLGLIGPIILILVTFLGLVELRADLSIKNIILIGLGVSLIIMGTR